MLKGTLTANASKIKQSQNVDRGLQTFIETHELTNLVNLFHIESRDFDPNIFLDTFHLTDPNNELAKAEKLLQRLRKTEAFKMAPEIKKLLLVSSSPLVLENYQHLKKIYTTLITKKLQEGFSDTIFSNQIKERLNGMIGTLSKIN